jgi:hypothetical protein
MAFLLEVVFGTGETGGGSGQNRLDFACGREL